MQVPSRTEGRLSVKRLWLPAILFAVALCAASQWVRAQSGSDSTVHSEALAGTNEAATAAEGEEEEITTGMAFVLKLKQGGAGAVILLLAVSVFGVSCAIERAFDLRRRAICPSGLSDEGGPWSRAGKFSDIQDIERPEPRACLRNSVGPYWRRHPRSALADVSSLAGDVASRHLRRHLQKAYPLAVVATIAPLLGLLGTVIGMIGAFDKVSAAGSLGDASMLGEDISKALITTGVGASIAVPALASTTSSRAAPACTESSSRKKERVDHLLVCGGSGRRRTPGGGGIAMKVDLGEEEDIAYS